MEIFGKENERRREIKSSPILYYTRAQSRNCARGSIQRILLLGFLLDNQGFTFIRNVRHGKR